MGEINFSAAKIIGLIGCGTWGTNILRDLISLNCQVLVVDSDHQARVKAFANGATKTFANLDDLPVCAGYVVAVPIPDLTKTCAALLKYKKPIFSEKTLCRSLNDFNLLNSAGGADYIFVMHKWHYHPGIEALRLVAQSNKIGELQELNTTRHAWVNDFHGGDVFWTQAVHDLTIVKHILGYIPNKINAIHVSKNEDGLPVGFTTLLGRNPAVVISVSGGHCHKRSGVSIQGIKGIAELYHACDDHITIRNKKGEKRITIDTTFPLYLELKEFVGYLYQGPPPRCNLQSAREITLAILNLRKKAGLKDNSANSADTEIS